MFKAQMCQIQFFGEFYSRLFLRIAGAKWGGGGGGGRSRIRFISPKVSSFLPLPPPFLKALVPQALCFPSKKSGGLFKRISQIIRPTHIPRREKTFSYSSWRAREGTFFPSILRNSAIEKCGPKKLFYSDFSYSLKEDLRRGREEETSFKDGFLFRQEWYWTP